MMFYSWQFAADGIWEDALCVDATQSIDVEAVSKWILEQPQNVAFEAVFAENGKPSTMFGLRITDLPKVEQVERIKALLLQTDQISSEEDIKNCIIQIFPEYTLFHDTPTALNIGIIAQWFSFGEQMIWGPSMDAPLNVWELKDKAPKFFERTDNPAAVELWYTDPVDHWYKIYVSDECEGQYVVSEKKYSAAIERLL